jgi:cytochrome c1
MWKCLPPSAAAFVLAACIRDDLAVDGADVGRDAADAFDTRIPDAADAGGREDAGPAAEVDARDALGDAASGTQDGEAVDVSFDFDADGWEVDPSSPLVLGRPFELGGEDGAPTFGAFVPEAGQPGAYVPVGFAGALTVEGRVVVAPDEGAHAAIVRVGGGVEAPRVRGVAYVDGAIGQPEVPRIALCEGALVVTVNDVTRRSARLVRLSADLEGLEVATFEAQPGLGASVELGAPTCGGPGFVVALDAVGGAVFTAPDGRKSLFAAEQTDGRTLMVNGTKVFAENVAQTVSANAMRIVHIARGAGQKILYVGEATAERQIGETRIVPGDQLVYQHDFATSTGGSIASQGFFGRKDIKAIAGASDGRFAVVWQDVLAPAAAGDPEVVETVVSAFQADGAKAWTKRSALWNVATVDFVGADLRLSGTFRSLEVLGLAAVASGDEDAFLAVLGGADGARKRHVNAGAAGVSSAIVGRPFLATGSDTCDEAALDAILVASGQGRRIVAVSESGVRCASPSFEAGGAALQLTAARAVGALDLWLGAAPLADGLVFDSAAWAPSRASLGPLRAKLGPL